MQTASNQIYFSFIEMIGKCKDGVCRYALELVGAIVFGDTDLANVTLELVLTTNEDGQTAYLDYANSLNILEEDLGTDVFCTLLDTVLGLFAVENHESLEVEFRNGLED